IENVSGFELWGPRDANGRPLKSKLGEYFRTWWAAMTVDYTGSYRVLTAKHYGDPQDRDRLWMIFKRGNKRKVFFPNPTHRDPQGQPDLFDNHLPTWPVARDIIDFTLPTESVIAHHLVPNTLTRILAGLHEFMGLRWEFAALPDCPPLPVKPQKRGARVSPYAEQGWRFHYLNCALRVALGRPLRKNNRDLIGEPSKAAIRVAEQILTAQLLPTDAGAVSSPVAQFLIKLYGTSRTADLWKATPTVTAGGNHLGFVVVNNGGSDGYERLRDLDTAMPTVTGASPIVATFVTMPQPITNDFLVSYEHASDGRDRVASTARAMPTLTTKPDWSIATAFMQLVAPAAALAEDRAHSAFIASYYGTTQGGTSLQQPLPTVVTHDRFLLVAPALGAFDIRVRMLDNSELRKAQSIPDEFKITGLTRAEERKGIGNAWSLKAGTAVMLAAME
ncbi:MAG: DNA cytosine methyltransferase, partial [Xanthomonadales bacterium]|nr:DNA cytosine methyltransferase [Xanthomonadales bacterium]